MRRLRVPGRLAGVLVAPFLLGPGAARANDLDMRATTIPAAGCVEVLGVLQSGDTAGVREALGPDHGGYFFLARATTDPNRFSIFRVRCPLPLSNIDLSARPTTTTSPAYASTTGTPDGPSCQCW